MLQSRETTSGQFKIVRLPGTPFGHRLQDQQLTCPERISHSSQSILGKRNYSEALNENSLF